MEVSISSLKINGFHSNFPVKPKYFVYIYTTLFKKHNQLRLLSVGYRIHAFIQKCYYTYF